MRLAFSRRSERDLVSFMLSFAQELNPILNEAIDAPIRQPES